MIKTLRSMALAAALLALAACSSLLRVPPTPYTIHTLRAPAQLAPGKPVDWQLVVETPAASGALDSVRMLVSPKAGTLEVFPGARWSDPAPTLLREVVIEAFERSGRIAGVGPSTSALHADYSLGMNLHDLQLDATASPPTAVLVFQARLQGYPDNRVLAARAFEMRAPARASTAAAAFEAFQAGLDRLLPELVEWTLAEGEAAHARDTPRK